MRTQAHTKGYYVKRAELKVGDFIMTDIGICRVKKPSVNGLVQVTDDMGKTFYWGIKQ